MDNIEIYLNHGLILAVLDTEATSTTVEAPTPAVCEDTSTKCGEFEKYCGTNSYVKERCPKTCGQCGRSSYLQYNLFQSFENKMDHIGIHLTHGIAFQQYQIRTPHQQLLRHQHRLYVKTYPQNAVSLRNIVEQIRT